MSAVYHGSIAGVVLTTGFATKNPVTIASDGTITGSTAGYKGAALYASGYAWTIANQGTVSTTGTGSPAIDLGAGGTIANSGTIATTGHKSNAVDLGAGGSVVNGPGGATAALVSGVYTGIAAYGAPTTITNYGTIAATGTAFQLPAYVSGVGIYLGAGGLITNGASGSTAAVIGGYTTAISVQNTAGTIVNFGTLRNTAFGDTIYLGAGATGTTIVNQAGGLITGRSAIDTSPATAASGGVVIANYGTITNTDSTAADIYLGHGGQITNAAGGLIAGRYIGVSIGGGAGTVINAGTIVGAGGIAIQLGAGDDQIVIEAGSTLGGAVGNFHPGDTFDLPSLSFTGGTATLEATNVLQIDEGTFTGSINLDPNQNFTGDYFHLASDGSNGTLITENTTPPEVGTVITVPAGPQTVIGSAGDTIIGGSGPDVISGLAGSMSITGGSGATTVFGGTGDTITGGTGTTVIVSPGEERISGGSGSTTIWGGAGDTIRRTDRVSPVSSALRTRQSPPGPAPI